MLINKLLSAKTLLAMFILQARRQLLFNKAGGRRSFRQLERLVRQQNNYFTNTIISKTSEMTNDNDEIDSASSVLFEIILLALDSSFI